MIRVTAGETLTPRMPADKQTFAYRGYGGTKISSKTVSVLRIERGRRIFEEFENGRAAELLLY